MIRFLTLAGYLELTMYLQISGKLDQHINTHYAYLAYTSMVLSSLLAVIQLVIWMRSLKSHSHLHGKMTKLTSPVILVILVLVGFSVLTVTLDSMTVVAKGYNFLLAAGSAGTASDDGTIVQHLRSDTSSYFTFSAYGKKTQKELERHKDSGELEITAGNYMEVMELIYFYPDEFMEREITCTGFVYNKPGHEGYQFLFRFGIIHCIADFGVYGLLTTGNGINYVDNTWVTATGTTSLEYNQTLEQIFPVPYITEMKEANEPDNPHVYRVF